MDHKIVEKLEEKIDGGIAGVIVKMRLKTLPLLPHRHTFQMMAKAAVSADEAAVENKELGVSMCGRFTLRSSPMQ